VGFLNPWILAGLAAVSVPILIHLLNKFRVRKSRWAAMRFILESLQKNRRRLQIEDLILLILRCLVVVCLILAFARPVLRALLPALPGGNGPAAIAIVLDNSASMGQSNGVSNRFAEAKKTIGEMLGHLDAGSQVAFFLVSDRPDALIAKPSPDITRARRSLELAAIADRPTNLAQGIRAAFEALKPVPSQRREILVYTDSQASGWRDLDEIRQLAAANPGIALNPVILGDKGEDNLAIIGLQEEGGVPAAGRPCRFRVDVANYGAQPVSGLRVTLSSDGQPPSDEALIQQIAPGATESVHLFARLDSSGFHAVTASIPPDRLAIDNERAGAVQAADRIGVLIVENSTQVPPGDRDGFFLANALAPVSGDQLKQYYLNVASVPFSGLAKASLSSYDAVFLCNPGSLSDSLVASLKTYVGQGGNLVIFPGPATDPAAWGKNAALQTLLPATLGPKKTASPPVALQSSGFDHPVTAIWNDRGEGSLSAVRYTNYFPLAPRHGEAPGASASTILRLANNDPAAVEWPFGKGRVVLFNAPATPQWSNLPLHPGFVALTQRLLGYLNRGSATRLVLTPGETFELPVATELLGKDFSIVRPGKDSARRPAGRVEMADQRAVISYRDTDAVGAYRIYIGQEEHAAAVFAVQLDPTESDLRQEKRAEVEALAAPASSGSAAPQAAAMTMQVKKEYWALFLWLAALLALAEAALAHRMSVSR